MKSEAEIKELLKENFKNVGNFQQTEFNSFSTSSRRDFVILGDDYFHYYEIKTEKDNFSRLASQISNAVGLFTEMFIVAPLKKIYKLSEMNVDVNLMSIDQLENGDLEISSWRQQSVKWKLSIEKVIKVLWKDDLFHYIKEKDLSFVRGSNTVDDMQKVFLKYYSDEDCFYILNDLLPNRNYDYRKANGSKNI